MSSNSKPLLILALLFLFLLPVFTSRVGASSEDTTTLAITQAEETFASAYEAVLEAEHVGATVEGIVESNNRQTSAESCGIEVEVLEKIQ